MPPSKSKAHALQLASDKLEASGLTLEHAAALNIEVLSAEETQQLGYLPLPALKINYYDPKGRPLRDWPKAPPFYRLRYLEQLPGFQKLTEAKPLRYVQPKNTGCCAYFPKSQDWSCLQNVDIPILITEGELKAASSCVHGFVTIGLGGVNNWRSLDKGLEFLPELESIQWLRRCVYLVFDSDLQTNPQVCQALRQLAEELLQRGAYAHLTLLPQLGPGAKTGLDDLLVAAGPADVEASLHVSSPIGLTKPLFEFNDRYLYIRHPGLILNRQSFEKVSASSFKEHVESTRRYAELQVKPNGDVSRKLVSAAPAWLGWPLRAEAARLTYVPGVIGLTDQQEFSLWPGWGVEPHKADIKPFFRLLTHLFEGAEPEALDWFLRWCAAPLQTPGLKMFSSVLFHGVKHGTGKSLLGYTLKRIYGKNFVEIKQADLHASFNEWAENKQLVLGDDITGSNNRQDADLLKKLITQQEVRVNVKYVPSYVVPDCINYIFTSNHPDAFFLEDDDRRFFIHEVVVDPLPIQFYTDYVAWLSDKGAASVFDYLLRLDLRGFNPAAPAMRTQAKNRMISDVQSDLGGWVRQLLADPEGMLRLGEVYLKQDLFTNEELLGLYDPMGKTGVTPNGLGRALRAAGVHQALQGQPLRVVGQLKRYYIIRNVAEWKGASSEACRRHLTPIAQAKQPAERVGKSKKY